MPGQKIAWLKPPVPATLFEALAAALGEREPGISFRNEWPGWRVFRVMARGIDPDPAIAVQKSVSKIADLIASPLENLEYRVQGKFPTTVQHVQFEPVQWIAVATVDLACQILPTPGSPEHAD